jgi:hypothetical protein
LNDALDHALAATVDAILAEGGMSMSQAARYIDELYSLPGVRRAPTHPSTPLRWHTRGHRRSDGTRVYLAAVRIGGKWVTSKQRIREFVVAQQELPASPTPRAPAELQRAAAAAERELESEGGI